MAFAQGHALVIGVGSHQLAPHLDVPITVADAKAVAETLQDSKTCGYPPAQVQLLTRDSATKSGILAALGQLAERVKPEETVFLYYCGHGALGTDGNYYLVSHDAKLEDGRVAKDTGVSQSELIHQIKAIPAKRVLMIFNTRLSGNVSPTLAIEDQSLDAESLPEASADALVIGDEGRVIITACEDTQNSHMGNGPVSIFTKAVLDALRGRGSARNNGGYIDCFNLYENVRESVLEAVQEQLNAAQEPALTALEGAETFPVALFKGATALGDFDASRPLPKVPAVRQVERRKTPSNGRLRQTRSGDTFKLGDIIGSIGVAIGHGARSFVTIVIDGVDKLQELLRLQRLSITIGIVVLLTVLAILVIQLRSFWIPPLPMTGDVNVAVAQFGEEDAKGRVVASKVGALFANSFYEELNDEIDVLREELEKAESGELKYDIQLRGPDEVGRIRGTTAEEREKSAYQLANEIQADVVVYGYLELADSQTTFVPEFYISDRLLQNAEELTGQQQVAGIKVLEDIRRNMNARAELRRRLMGGPRSLSYFIVGLSNFIYHRFDAAQTYFHRAIDASTSSDPELQDPELQKIFLLFLGKTAHETKDWGTAGEYYSQTLQIDPEFARAQLGFADTIFQQARGNCTMESTDAEGLELAISEYQKALAASDLSGLSNIGIKVSFYLGRAYCCQSLAGLADRWSKAECSTKSVIEAYEMGNDLVEAQASEAHANLGLIYWTRPTQDEQTKTSDLEEAASEYLKAIELAKWPERQGVFYRYLAELYEALHEYDKADEAWQQAMRLEKHETPVYPDLRQQFLKERQATPTVN